MELLLEVARVCDLAGIAQLRLVCKAVRLAIDEDKSLPWHSEWLRAKAARVRPTEARLRIYLENRDILHAAPAGTRPFAVNFLCGDDIAWMRAADHALRNLDCMALGGDLRLLHDLQSVVALHTWEPEVFGSETVMLPNLRELHCPGGGKTSFPPNLQRLSLFGCRTLQVGRVQRANADTIRVLSVSGSWDWLQSDFEAFVKAATRLHTLRLLGTHSRFMLSPKLQVCGHIRHLEIRLDALIPEDMELPLDLESLQIHPSERCYEYSERAERLDLSMLLRLRSLTLGKLDLRNIGRIALPPALEYLDISANPVRTVHDVSFPTSLRTLKLPPRCEARAL